MKNLLFFLVLLSCLFFSCDKENVPEHIGLWCAGNYCIEFSEYEMDSYTFENGEIVGETLSVYYKLIGTVLYASTTLNGQYFYFSELEIDKDKMLLYGLEFERQQ